MQIFLLCYLIQSEELARTAVNNTVPVTVYATFNFTALPGYNLADYCLGSSHTVELIADNYTRQQSTRFASFFSDMPYS
jgi:hypothetical protein